MWLQVLTSTISRGQANSVGSLTDQKTPQQGLFAQIENELDQVHVLEARRLWDQASFQALPASLLAV